jgi:diguanylate cyclase (GGDEF)-like protein/PAS domain S-box-containing protein
MSLFLREYEEESTDWLWTTDTAGTLTDAGAHMAAALGVAAEQLASLRLQDLLVTPDPAANSRTALHLATCLRDGLAFRDLLTIRHVSGGMRWFALTGHPVFNARGVPSGFRGIGRDITASREANERIAFLARHDSLTELPNRQAFLETIDQLSDDGRPFVLALIDLDNFKTVNDNYGHETGDGLLRCVAARLRQAIRPGDIAARLGGDEFAALIPGADGPEGLAIARRIATRLCEPARIGDITLTPGASLGVSVAPEHGTDRQRMMMLADLALYKAKEQSKGAVRLFVPALEEDYRSRMTQEAELRLALEKRQIAVEYQPVVDISTGQVVSAEALIRWDHPTRGPISPDAFIPIAERSDLMEHLGELVLRVACNDAAAWPAGIQVNINLSPRQLRSGRFLQILSEALEGSGLPPQRLGVEVTETLLLDGTEETLRQLRSLRETGVSLILDDFGSGYSSLTYLNEIEVDGIKIDAGFTRKLPSRKVAAIYRMIARLAADLNIYVVAEGVETSEQLAWLRQNGIPFAQGFLLGPPRRSPPSTRAVYLA